MNRRYHDSSYSGVRKANEPSFTVSTGGPQKSRIAVLADRALQAATASLSNTIPKDQHSEFGGGRPGGAIGTSMPVQGSVATTGFRGETRESDRYRTPEWGDQYNLFPAGEQNFGQNRICQQESRVRMTGQQPCVEMTADSREDRVCGNNWDGQHRCQYEDESRQMDNVSYSTVGDQYLTENEFCEGPSRGWGGLGRGQQNRENFGTVPVDHVQHFDRRQGLQLGRGPGQWCNTKRAQEQQTGRGQNQFDRVQSQQFRVEQDQDWEYNKGRSQQQGRRQHLDQNQGHHIDVSFGQQFDKGQDHHFYYGQRQQMSEENTEPFHYGYNEKRQCSTGRQGRVHQDWLSQSGQNQQLDRDYEPGQTEQEQRDGSHRYGHNAGQHIAMRNTNPNFGKDKPQASDLFPTLDEGPHKSSNAGPNQLTTINHTENDGMKQFGRIGHDTSGNSEIDQQNQATLASKEDCQIHEETGSDRQSGQIIHKSELTYHHNKATNEMKQERDGLSSEPPQSQMEMEQSSLESHKWKWNKAVWRATNEMKQERDGLSSEPPQSQMEMEQSSLESSGKENPNKTALEGQEENHTACSNIGQMEDPATMKPSLTQKSEESRKVGRKKDGMEEDDEDTDYTHCKLCSMEFDSSEKYHRHIRGLLHTQRQIAAEEHHKSGGYRESQTNLPLDDKPQSQGTSEKYFQSKNWHPHGGHVTEQFHQAGASKQPRQSHPEHMREVLHRQQQPFQESTKGQRPYGQEEDGCGRSYEESPRKSLGEQERYGGQEQWDEEYGKKEENWQQQPPELFGDIALKEQGAFRTGYSYEPTETDTSGVQRHPAADRSQGLALITGAGEEDDYAEEEEGLEDEDKINTVKEEPGEFHCSLCDIYTTGAASLQAHLNGRNHKLVHEAVQNGTAISRRLALKLGPNAQILNKTRSQCVDQDVEVKEGPSKLLKLLSEVPEAIVGLRFVKEFHVGRMPTFLCTVCDSQCDFSAIQTHLIGTRHRLKYLQEYHAGIYRHVKTHGGKKSQLSAFLEEVCRDVENKMGRGSPLVIQSADGTDAKEMPAGKKPDVKKEFCPGPSDPPVRSLPHEVVVANYHEDKNRAEMSKTGPGPLGSGYDQDQSSFSRRERGGSVGSDHGRGRNVRDVHDPVRSDLERNRDVRNTDEYIGQRDRGPSERDWERGRDFREDRREALDFGRDYRDSSPYMDEDRRMLFGFRDRSPYMDESRRVPYFDLARRPRDYLPFRDRDMPWPQIDEEERRKRMYDYERDNFYFPEMGITPEEARRRMFVEYHRLGIPYELARERVLIQEDRQMQLRKYLREGMPLKDAQRRVIAAENRMRLIRDFERQGLSHIEAKWRVIVEEERTKLFENYEQRGFTPLQARVRIMDGHERTHLINEFERHGMPPEEALRRALAEEKRLKQFMDSASKGVEERDGRTRRENMLDDIAEKRMLDSFIEQGDSRDEAENKVIMVLRRQGVPTQEAIIRVQKILKRDAGNQEKTSSSYIPENLPAAPEADSSKTFKSEETENLSKSSKTDKDDEPEEGSPRSFQSGKNDTFSKPHRHEPVDEPQVLHHAQSESSPTNLSKSEMVHHQSKSYSHEKDDMSLEEAKERLLHEYEKRGIPREQARQSLINELIQSGVSPEVAEFRFRDYKPAAEGAERSENPKETRSHRKRKNSPSRSRSSENPKERGSRRKRKISRSPSRSSSSSSSSSDSSDSRERSRVKKDRRYRNRDDILDSTPSSARKEAVLSSSADDDGRIHLSGQQTANRKSQQSKQSPHQSLDSWHVHQGEADKSPPGFHRGKVRLKQDLEEIPAKQARLTVTAAASLQHQGQGQPKQVLGQAQIASLLESLKHVAFPPKLDIPTEQKQPASTVAFSAQQITVQPGTSIPTVTKFDPNRASQLKAKHDQHTVERSVPTVNTSDLNKTSQLHAKQTQPASQPGPSKRKAKTEYDDLLESLTNNLISSEDDAAMALQVSKALTSALLKYRLKPVPNVEGQASKSKMASEEQGMGSARKLPETACQATQVRAKSSQEPAQFKGTQSSRSQGEEVCDRDLTTKHSYRKSDLQSQARPRVSNPEQRAYSSSQTEVQRRQNSRSPPRSMSSQRRSPQRSIPLQVEAYQGQKPVSQENALAGKIPTLQGRYVSERKSSLPKNPLCSSTALSFDRSSMGTMSQSRRLLQGNQQGGKPSQGNDPNPQAGSFTKINPPKSNLVEIPLQGDLKQQNKSHGQSQKTAHSEEEEDQDSGGVFDRPLGCGIITSQAKNKMILPRVIYTKRQSQRGGGSIQSGRGLGQNPQRDHASINSPKGRPPHTAGRGSQHLNQSKC